MSRGIGAHGAGARSRCALPGHRGEGASSVRLEVDEAPSRDGRVIEAPEVPDQISEITLEAYFTRALTVSRVVKIAAVFALCSSVSASTRRI